MTVTTRPAHPMRSVCIRNGFAAGSSGCKTGFTTAIRNTNVPAVTTVAAKCTARVAIKDVSAAAPNHSMTWPFAPRLAADLEREVAVGRVRIYRNHVPRYMVGARTAWSDRDR